MDELLGTLAMFGLIVGVVGVDHLLRSWAKGYKRKQEALREADHLRQQAEDDQVLAYMAFCQQQDLLAREARMAAARKLASPSFQDYDLKKCKEEVLGLPMPS